MNTQQLRCAMDSDPALRSFSREVFAKDQFIKAMLEDKGAYICNDQPSTEKGNHWFLIYIEPTKIYFIDSFARKPNYYGIDWKLKTLKKPIYQLKNILQNPFSTVCGKYCLFFIYHLCRNYSLEYIVNNYFSNDCVLNDENVKDFVWRKYPGHERDFTNIFWFRQNKL